MADRLTDVTLPDLRDLDRRLAALAGRDGPRIRSLADAAAARVARKAARRSAAFADRTGRLRSSLVVRRSRGRVQLRADAPHAALVELGHGGPHPAPPHPFLVPAVMSAPGEQLRAAAKVAERELRKLLHRS